MKHYPALLVGLVLVAGCTRSTQLPADFQPDYGPTVYQTNRPITGVSVSTPLGRTGFRAVVAVMHYTDETDTVPDFYFINVEHGDLRKGNGSMVCYQRQFPVSSIPASVLTAKAKDVVSFDSANRQVIFKLGVTNQTYTLPHTHTEPAQQSDAHEPPPSVSVSMRRITRTAGWAFPAPGR